MPWDRDTSKEVFVPKREPKSWTCEVLTWNKDKSKEVSVPKRQLDNIYFLTYDYIDGYWCSIEYVRGMTKYCFLEPVDGVDGYEVHVLKDGTKVHYLPGEVPCMLAVGDEV